MNSIQDHVDTLFKGYGKSKEIKELKEEIISNLEAKVTDLTSNGMDYNQAVVIATSSIESIDPLIEGNKEVYVNIFKTELSQIALLYFLIAWVITIPLRFISVGFLINPLLLIAVILTGAIFLSFNSHKEQSFLGKTSVLNIKLANRYRKFAWLIWSLFILTSIASLTTIQFGSNLWFSRPVKIDGPYQFAVLITRYFVPFITIIIPLLFNVAIKLIFKYEVGGQSENEK
jgi:hypothetical protein